MNKGLSPVGDLVSLSKLFRLTQRLWSMITTAKAGLLAGLAAFGLGVPKGLSKRSDHDGANCLRLHAAQGATARNIEMRVLHVVRTANGAR
jgi:hypothetical protein